MAKELVISATPHETRVAILEDGQLCEIYVEREKEFALVGSIYKGRVTRVLPGMQSAFVDIGHDSDAFLYVSDFLEGLEEYEHIVTTVEGKVEKMEQEGGRVFAPDSGGSGPALEPAEVSSPTSEPAVIPLLGEVISSAEPAQGSAEAPALPVQNRPTYPPRNQESAGSGRDRGGRGGRGRWGYRGGRGRDRRGGRDLPPSKYASPRPFENRPYEPRPYEPPPAGYEPVVLPGESLAKYKDRVPAPAAVPPTEDQAPSAEASFSPAATAPSAEAAPDLAVPVIGAISQATPEVPPDEIAPAVAAEPDTRQGYQPASAQETSPAARVSEAATQTPAIPTELRRARTGAVTESREETVSAATSLPDLTAEEQATLAEQVAEAQREEADAEAESREEENEFADEVDSRGGELIAEGEDAALETGESEAAEAAAEGPAEAGSGPEEGGPASVEAQPPEARQLTARVQDNSRARFQRPIRRGGRRPGRFHGRPHDDRQHAPRRPQLISEMLRAGQEIIVQIAKEPLGKKGARITSHVALPGRFLVYMPTVDHIGVSRKIGSAEERSRLRRLLLEMKGSFPGGFIVRTAAAGASEEELRSDVEFLGRTWGEIRARAEQRKAPAILHRDLNLVERILRDHLSPEFISIWIDNEEEYAKVVEFVGRFQPKLVNRVKLYTKQTPMFEELGIQQEIDKSLRPKVWLKSGGYIVINHTEALVAIDVNTGKFVGKGSTRLEDTIVKTNVEAVKEIVRQIRLRDLGGIIVVDFIDMEERKNRARVMQALDEALRSDKAPSKVLAFNEFGLVAITRKRTKQALERVLCQPCPYCTGSGMVKSLPTICYEIQAEARKMAQELESQSLTLRVHPDVAKALKTRESALIEELEQWARKSVIIQSDPTLHWEQYDIY